MQADRRQSFIQQLKEPGGWLLSDLALDCTVSPGARPLQTRSLFLKKVLAVEGTDGSAGGTAALRSETCHSPCVLRGTGYFLLAKQSLNRNAQRMLEPLACGASGSTAGRARQSRAPTAKQWAQARTVQLNSNEISAEKHKKEVTWPQSTRGMCFANPKAVLLTVCSMCEITAPRA